MIAGTLEIQLMADLARLKSDMDQAKQVVATGVESIKGVLGGLAATLASGLSLKALKDMVGGFIDAQAALHDLSIQTGLSVAALAQFKGVGGYTNTSIDAISAASAKLSKNLAGMGDETKGAGKALAALGIDFDTFRQMKPEDQMLLVAKSMAKFEDGTGKTAAAMMVFGKEGAKLLPFLADLAEKHDDITGALTEEQKAIAQVRADMADAFGDNLTALRKNSESWKKELAAGVLPALYEASEALKAMFGGTNSLGAEIKRLAADGSITTWARNLITYMSYAVDAVQLVWRVLGTGIEIGRAVFGALLEMAGAFTGAMEAIGRRDWSGAWQAVKTGFSNVRAVGVDAAAAIGNQWGDQLLGAQLRARLEDLKGIPPPAKAAKEHLDLTEPLQKNRKAAKEQKTEFDKLLEKTAELILQQQAEVDQGTKLSAADKLLVDAKKVLSGAELETLAAMLKVAKQQESDIEFTKFAVEANKKRSDAIFKEAEAIAAKVLQQKAENEALGKTPEQLLAIEQARLLDMAASKEREAAIDASITVMSDEQKALLKTAEQYRELAQLKGDNFGMKAALDAQRAWTEAAQRIGADLADALIGGWSSFKNYLKNALANFFIRVPLQGVMTSIVGGVGAMLGMPALAGQAGSAASGLGGLGSLFGAGSSLGALGSALSGGWGMTMSGLSGTGFALDGAMSMLGNGEIMAGLGQAAGALGPYALAAAAIAGLVKSLDKSGTPHTGSVVTADAFGARTGGADPTRILDHFNAGTDTALKSLAGGAVDVLNMLSGAFGGLANFQAMTKFAADGVDASFGAFALSRGGSQVGAIPFAGAPDAKAYSSDAKAAFEAFGGDVGLVVRQALNVIDLPKWASDALGALGASPGIDVLTKAAQELAQTKAALDGLGGVLMPMGGLFERLAMLGEDAKLSLAGMVGGIDQLIAKSRGFVETYYTKEEQASITARQILEQVQKAGVDSATYAKIAGLTDKASFRALLETLDPAKGDGIKLAALGLNIAQPFAGITDALAEAHKTLGELASLSITPVVQQLLDQAQASMTGSAAGAAADAASAATTAAASTASSTAATAESVAAAVETLQEIAANTKADVAGIGEAITVLNGILVKLTSIESAANLAATAPETIG